METRFFDDFLSSGDTLRVYEAGKLTFASAKDRLLPLLEYADKFFPYPEGVVIFDKIMGNAAALLAVRVNCRGVYSPLGSELAIRTLDKYSITYHFARIVPFIMKPDGRDMCPMEKLSIGKTPEEFYQAVKKRTQEPNSKGLCFKGESHG